MSDELMPYHGICLGGPAEGKVYTEDHNLILVPRLFSASPDPMSDGCLYDRYWHKETWIYGQKCSFWVHESIAHGMWLDYLDEHFDKIVKSNPFWWQGIISGNIR